MSNITSCQNDMEQAVLAHLTNERAALRTIFQECNTPEEAINCAQQYAAHILPWNDQCPLENEMIQIGLRWVDWVHITRKLIEAFELRDAWAVKFISTDIDAVLSTS